MRSGILPTKLTKERVKNPIHSPIQKGHGEGIKEKEPRAKDDGWKVTWQNDDWEGWKVKTTETQYDCISSWAWTKPTQTEPKNNNKAPANDTTTSNDNSDDDNKKKRIYIIAGLSIVSIILLGIAFFVMK